MLVVSSVPDPPWLPEGGRADVVLAAPGDEPPTPVGLVRLLVTGPHGRVFTVPRTGGRPGLDLPTAAVPVAASVRGVLAGLVSDVLGRTAPTVQLGFVRNTVPPGTVYEWPSPVAHFCVYRTVDPQSPVVDGTWLDRDTAAVHLAERHWWPLLAVEAGGGPRATVEYRRDAAR